MKRKSGKRGPVAAKKVSYDGINFASGLERYTYMALKKNKLFEGYENEVFQLVESFNFDNESFEKQANGKGEYTNRGQKKILGIKYTPDFILRKSDGSKMYIETKGLWTVKDRFKARLVHEEHDPLDLRYVFSNQNARLYKGSPTSYAMYCQRLGWKYAHKVIPEEWLAECVK